MRYLPFLALFVYNKKKEVCHMRSLSRLLVVLILCLASIAVPGEPGQAADGGAYITLSPSFGVPGEEIRIRGYNFTTEEWIDIYYYLNGSRIRVAEVKTDEDGDFPSVTFTVPESYTGDHDVRAVEDTSGAYAEDIFEVKPGLTVEPEEGTVGADVTVTGHGFAADEEDIQLIYYPDGDSEVIQADIPVDEYGSWNWTFQIPPSTRGGHKLDARGDDSTLGQVEDAIFIVIPGISISESSGSAGDTITMTGNGFEANERDIKILFDGEEMETDPDIIRAEDTGNWTGYFQVPDMPKGTYPVTAEGEWTEGITPLSFKIEPGLTLSPNEGHVGTNVTVTGGGFAANRNVDIMYDGSHVETTGTNSTGGFEVTFPVPESPHGQRQVTAQDTAGNNATGAFTMESDPPEPPQLISPADGARVGFIGTVRPAFEWSAASDPSGVRYSLQVATSGNVTSTGEFVDAIVSVPDIGATNYTLTATQALPYGTYYWIVQAVDGADNAGTWTAAGSFRVGLVPMWAFIVIIVAIVALIGTLLYFFVIRKRLYYY
jgi:hypothetical protein